MHDVNAAREEIARILASPGFHNADRLKRLLCYTTDKALAGKESELKEYTLGVDVFERGVDFDPKVDSIVRVTFGKLRLKLKEYYAANGSSHVRIEYPPGTYAPRFLEPQDASSATKRFAWLCAALTAAALAAVIAMAPRDRPIRRILKQLTSDGLSRDSAISRDGTLVAYVSNREDVGYQLYIQQIAGGRAMKLPGIAGNASAPSFSPDGSMIVFGLARSHSEHDPSPRATDIYVTPTLGGTPRKIVEGGGRPSFSPDGQWIAYGHGWSRIFLVNAKGGTPKQISPPHFELAHSPVFTPDGKHILFYGRPVGPNNALVDWWVISLDDGTLVKTGAKDIILAAESQPADADFRAIANGWLEEKVLFSWDASQRANLSTVPIDSRTWKVRGPLERMTFGSGVLERFGSVSDTDRVVFTSSVRSARLYWLEGDLNRGEVAGQPHELTAPAMNFHGVTVSRDGTRMSYGAARNGVAGVWSHDLSSGESYLHGTGRHYRPSLSQDGTKVVYQIGSDRRYWMVVAAFESGEGKTICEDCLLAQGWTPDGRKVLWGFSHYLGLKAVDVSTGIQQTWIDSKRPVQVGGFSPDGEWLSLTVGSAGSKGTAAYVAPFRDGLLAPESQWVRVRSGSEQLQWSPDGGMLYFLATADGHRCLYAQRLDKHSKRPIGEPFAVYHLHDPERRIFGSWAIPFNFAVTRNRLYLSIEREQSDVWMLDPG